MEKMEAVVKFGRKDGDVGIREADIPTINADQVLVKVAAAGVCGSDIHLWREHQSWAIKIPVILGHEFCGTIAQVGSAVKGWKEGDRVAVETAAYVCGQCAYCLTGNYNLCPHRLGYGNLIDGAMTQYVPARTQILHRIPENVTFEKAALTEPVCVATKALVEKSRINPGDTVVVQGVGTIGIMALLVARLCGAGTIIALGTGIDAHRLRIASQLGAKYALDVTQQNPLDLLRSLGDGFGADLVVDCSGSSAALKQAMELVRPMGAITKIGWGPQPLNYSLDPLVGKTVTLQGSFSHTYATWERALRMMSSGQLNLDPVIGGVYPLSEWQEAFLAMEEGRNIKSVLVNR